MQFKAGDYVVHPAYGVGNIVRLEERRLAEDTTRLYYVLTADKSTIWVPVDAVGNTGLRRLTSKHDLEKYRALLRGRPTSLSKDHRDRRLEIVERLKDGSFQAMCEVVRDLAAFGWRKALSEADATLFNKTRASLCREWAAAGNMSVDEAIAEVNTLLSTARQTYKP